MVSYRGLYDVGCEVAAAGEMWLNCSCDVPGLSVQNSGSWTHLFTMSLHLAGV